MLAYLIAALLGVLLVLTWRLRRKPGTQTAAATGTTPDPERPRVVPDPATLHWENVRYVRSLIEKGLDPQPFLVQREHLTDTTGVVHQSPFCRSIVHPAEGARLAVLDLVDGRTCRCADQDVLTRNVREIVRGAEEALSLERTLTGLPHVIDVDGLEERIGIVSDTVLQRIKASPYSLLHSRRIWDRIADRFDEELAAVRSALEEPETRQEVLTRAAWRHLEDLYRRTPPEALERSDVFEDDFSRSYLMMHAVRTWRKSRREPDRGALALLDLARRLFAAEVEQAEREYAALCEELVETFEKDLARLLGARRDTLVTFGMQPFNPPNSVLLVEAHTVPHETQVAYVPSWVAQVIRGDVGWSWVEQSRSFNVENLTEAQVETLLGLWTPNETGSVLAHLPAAAVAAELV